MRKLSIALAVLVLAACGHSVQTTSGVLGSPTPGTPSTVTGTVNFVDTSAHMIEMNVSSVNNLRSSIGKTSIYYDNRTLVQWAGRDYAPADLDRGDEVSVHGSNDAGRYMADTITVTRNVRQ